MPRSGTLVICVQNVDYSGANQVVLNVVAGRMHESNVIVLSPKIGAFAARFIASGAAIRIGNISKLLLEIRDVFCIICNTIMTADIVCEMAKRPQPVIWILHEWWDDKMITENLGIRNIGGLTLETVKQALIHASMIVFVCEAQRQLYKPTAPSSVIYVGVPAPLALLCDMQTDQSQLQLQLQEGTIEEETPSSKEGQTPRGITDISDLDFAQLSTGPRKKPYIFLCLGIVCPRKNQVWAVKLFKKFAGDRQDVKLVIVGARYTRQYEMEYLDEVKAAIDHDKRIELHDVTDEVDHFYRQANCLLFTSTNEVTPMVISEAMSWSLPVLSTNIAGIPEMITDGVEGFLFAPQDDSTALIDMNKIVDDEILRLKMGAHGLQRFKTRFDLDIMVESYRDLVMTVAPPIILIDMDGVLVDWDKGFYNAWNNRCPVNREKSYFMEQCVGTEYKREAELLMHSAGFFESLPAMFGGIQALKEMKAAGFKVFICTSPLMTSHYCAQEKLNWIRTHLGAEWLDKMILCFDKSIVKGDILIDDKPFEYLAPGGRHTTATWKPVLFDALYNRLLTNTPRITLWKDWRKIVIPLFGRSEVIEEMYRNLDVDMNLNQTLPTCLDNSNSAAIDTTTCGNTATTTNGGGGGVSTNSFRRSLVTIHNNSPATSVEMIQRIISKSQLKGNITNISGSHMGNAVVSTNNNVAGSHTSSGNSSVKTAPDRKELKRSYARSTDRLCAAALRSTSSFPSEDELKFASSSLLMNPDSINNSDDVNSNNNNNNITTNSNSHSMDDNDDDDDNIMRKTKGTAGTGMTSNPSFWNGLAEFLMAVGPGTGTGRVEQDEDEDEED